MGGIAEGERDILMPLVVETWKKDQEVYLLRQCMVDARLLEIAKIFARRPWQCCWDFGRQEIHI